VSGPQYEVYAIKYAHHARRASENFIGGVAQDAHDGPMPLDFFVWLIRGEGREFVVDTGFSAATRRGWLVLASDASHFYANMEQVRPFPIVFSVADMVEGYARLRELADSPAHIIPGHDPLVLQRYPAPASGLHGIVARLD
jgi:hypothetical protein